MMKYLFFTIFSYLYMTGILNAEPAVTGTQLKKACEYSESEPNTYCYGFIVGTMYGIEWGSELVLDQVIDRKKMSDDEFFRISQNIISICLPESFSDQKNVNNVKNFLISNSEYWHLDAYVVVWLALSKNYQCDG